jgi:hypothetical protein
MSTERCRDVLLHPKTFKTLKDWFDLELRPFIGLDVFRTPFPREQGYAMYETRFARVLVYRFEALHELASILTKFVGMEIPALVNSNVGESKEYAQQYRLVKENLRLPPDFVTSLYSSKLMRQFYSNEERLRWQARWAEASSCRCC